MNFTFELLVCITEKLVFLFHQPTETFGNHKYFTKLIEIISFNSFIVTINGRQKNF